MDVYAGHDPDTPFPPDQFTKLRMEMDWARNTYNQPSDGIEDKAGMQEMWADRFQRLVMMAQHNELLEMRREIGNGQT